MNAGNEQTALREFFERKLRTQCLQCRMKGRKFCTKALRLCAAVAICADERKRRRWHIRPSHEAIVDTRFRSFDAYLSSLDAQQFHEYTRLLRGEFMELQSRVAHRLQHVPTHSAPVSAMHRFALTLRYLGHGMSFLATAHELGLGKSTVRSIVYEGCRAIMAEFFAEAFPKPTRRTWEENAELFSRLWKYPRGVGSLDGKHFKVFAPHNSGSTYFNYKAYFSLVLLAIVNGGYRIVSFELGGKGRESDAGGEGVVDYHVLADGGFPQRTLLQRPFRRTEIENDLAKAHFNERFSSVRRIVKSVFGILSARFRIFQRALIGSPDNCKLLIAATLVLHNLQAQQLTPQQLLARYRPRISRHWIDIPHVNIIPIFADKLPARAISRLHYLKSGVMWTRLRPHKT
ncbi:hypothetical protein Q1695_012566 [Nippostrongylus brasiliensis]|nr:hypothetical protein Q1695_012566 [Nippostrongylus brasiliensis]